MVKLGVTYSPLLLDQLTAGTVDVDYVKVDADAGASVLRAALAVRPVLLHDLPEPFWLNYDDPFGRTDMAAARALLDLAGSPWLSTGIGASAEPQGHRAGPYREADTDAVQSRQTVISNIITHGRRLREWARVPLLLENYNYHPTLAYEYVCEPEVVSTVLDAVDCDMLLDLAHAQISAHNMGWTHVHAYLEALPLHRVREIHLNHPVLDGDRMLDRHLPTEASDLDLLTWVLQQTPAEIVTLEAEIHDASTLLVQVQNLRRAIGSL